MATEVAVREEAQVPALVQPHVPLEIDSSDVALPRLYIGQYMSDAVQEGTVAAGDIYVAAGKDDPDPEVLAKAPKGDKGVDPADGPVIYVLGMYKGKSVQENGELVLFDFNDPNAPAEAWTTYNYLITIPDHDEDVPYKWLVTRSSTPAAKQINTVLKKNERNGPPWLNAFKLGSVFKSNTKGKFYVARVLPAEATDEGKAVAEKLSQMVAGTTTDVAATGDEPAI